MLLYLTSSLAILGVLSILRFLIPWKAYTWTSLMCSTAPSTHTHSASIHSTNVRSLFSILCRLLVVLGAAQDQTHSIWFSRSSFGPAATSYEDWYEKNNRKDYRQMNSPSSGVHKSKKSTHMLFSDEGGRPDQTSQPTLYWWIARSTRHEWWSEVSLLGAQVPHCSGIEGEGGRSSS